MHSSTTRIPRGVVESSLPKGEGGERGIASKLNEKHGSIDIPSQIQQTASCRFAMPLLKDTRKAAERLQEGGVPEEQANAIVDLFVDADEQVATKGDLDHTEQQLRDEINHVEQQLRTSMEAMEERLTGRIQQTESRLLRWMIGVVGA